MRFAVSNHWAASPYEPSRYAAVPRSYASAAAWRCRASCADAVDPGLHAAKRRMYRAVNRLIRMFDLAAPARNPRR
jgi:hypothetical protein